MIKSIHVEGYQSLKDVQVELGRFTVILGESNVGKTAFLRAMKAVVENQSGLDFLTAGEKTCRVEVVLNSGADAAVIWEKKKTGTQYHVHSGETIGKMGKGTGVPLEVTNALRMERIEFAPGIKFAPNFHDQFSTPFLLEETGGRVAKMLGEMSGVNLLYRATAEANVRVKRNQQKEADLAEAIEKLKTRLAEYEYIRVKGPKLQEAKSILVAVQTDAHLLDRMAKSITEWKNWQTISEDAHQQREKLAPILGAAMPLDEAVVGLEASVHMRNSLVAWLRAILASREAGQAKEKLSKLKTVDFKPIEEAADEVFVMRKVRDGWVNAVHAAAYAQSYVGELKQEADGAQEKLQRLIEKLKVCPYCGHMLHKEGESCACCK